jgi:hypothetical protein
MPQNREGGRSARRIAVKIVQEGSLTKHATCKRCKSKLAYEPEDVKSTSWEDSGIEWYIQCPFCLKKLGPSYSFVYVEPPGKEAKT